jgi:O-antigen ligase
MNSAEFGILDGTPGICLLWHDGDVRNTFQKVTEVDTARNREFFGHSGTLQALVIAVLAFCLVGLHLLVDPRAYDVSQGVRLVTLLVGLFVAVPAVGLVPRVCDRIDWGVLREPVVLAAAAYLATCWLSVFGAINVSAGFGDCFRTLGAFLVLCVMALVLPLDSRWKRWLLEAAVVATLVAVVVGATGTLPLVAEGMPSRRALEMAFLDGLMSNVNLFAAWLLVLIPWCVCGAVTLTGSFRIASTATAAAAGVLVVVLQSRAAWLGLLAAAVIGGGAILVCRRSLAASDRLRRAVMVVFAVGIVTGLGLVGIALTDSPVGAAIRARVVTRPHQAAGPADGGRMMVWGLTVRMIEDHLWTGVGAGNFPIRLHEYFGPDEAGNIPDFHALSSDNWIPPHNDFLQVFAEKGLFGFLAFLAIFGFAGRAALSVLRRPGSPNDAWLALASLCALIAYATESCFDFPLDRVSHQVVLAVHLAVLAILSHENREPTPRRGVPGWLITPPVMAALAIGLCYAWAAWQQELDVMAARRAQHGGEWLAMREAARRGTTPWKTLDPLAVPVALLEGLAEVQLGDVKAATACFERAYAANPNRLAVLQNLGAAYAQEGRLSEAVAAFSIAANRYPDRLDVRHNLASALIDAGRFAEAVAVLEDVPEALRTPAMQEALDYARAHVAGDTAR